MWKSRVFSLVITLACLLGFSCKVGLGEAVDTVPPTVTINYPPAGSVVRDTFVLAGDCDDDTSVSSVDVYYERTGSFAMDKRLLGTVNVTAGDRTWALTIDPNTVDIKDGPYVFYAVAKDTQGRTSGTYTQSLEIDNTPPILILTKPTSYGSNSPKEYGRSVSIEGTFAEATENRIDKLVVTFYDENGNRITDLSAEDTTFNNITDMSNANPLIIAKRDLTGSTDALVKQRDEIYRALYGSDALNLGAKKFYFTVTAYDKARCYTDPSSGGTGEGNASTGFYRGTNDVLNLINGNKENYSSFSVKNIQEIESGLDDTYSGDQHALLRAWLAEALVDSAAPTVSTPRSALSTENLTEEKKAKALNFRMNPANYPTLSVSGLEIDPSAVDNHIDGYYTYFTGTPLNFTVMAGLDQTKIDVPTVSIYVEKVGDSSSRQLVWTWNPTLGAANPGKYTPTAEGENADSVAKTVALNFGDYTGMVNNTKWRFVAVGKDINDTDIQNFNQEEYPDGYGFIASVSAQAPTLEIGPEDAENYKNLKTNTVTNHAPYANGSYKYSGSVTSSETVSMSWEMIVSDDSGYSKKSNGNITPSGNTWSATLTPNNDAKTHIPNHKGLYTVQVTIRAENGSGKFDATRTLNIDNREPEVKNVSLEKADPSDSSSNIVKKDGVYYIRKNGHYDLSGITTDNYLVDKTIIKIEGNGTTITEERTSTSWNFNEGSDILDFSGFTAKAGENNDVKITVTACDKAGNQVDSNNVQIITVEFDDAAPAPQHEIDTKGKDVIFRIGDNNNDNFDPAHPVAEDKNVGGKYAAGTYGNSTTMKIRGDFTDEGSGVDMIYYQVYREGDGQTLINTSNYKEYCTDYFAPLAVRKNDKRVEKNNGDEKINVYPYTSFEAVLTGFEVGNNKLRLVAVDKVGNAVLDQEYTLNVDMTPPTIETLEDGSIPTNGIDPIATIRGTAKDEDSGIRSIEFYIGKPEYKITASGLAANGTKLPKGTYTLGDPDENGECEWSLNIDNSNGWLKDPAVQAIIGVNPGIYANVTDNAGPGLTTSAVKVASLIIDTTPPTITIDGIKDALTVNGDSDVQVNGVIDVSGKATDYALLDEAGYLPKLYYRKTNPGNGAITSTEGWTLIKSATGTNTWTCSGIDTKTAFGSNYSGNVWLMVEMMDKAGNTGYSAATKVVVDQNTDRPVIKFTTLDSASSWLQSTTLRGTINDDDGTVQALRIYIGDTCPNDWTLTASSVSSGTAVEILNGGDWNFDVGNDGTKKLWFYVKDAAGTVFISGRGDAVNKPYYLYASQDRTKDFYGNSAESEVVVNKDMTQPKIGTTLVSIGERDEHAATNPDDLEGIEALMNDVGANQLNSSKIVGGKKSLFVIYTPVYEEFVESVTARILDEDNNVETESYNINGGPKQVIPLTLTSATTVRDGNTYVYYRGEVVDVSPLADDKSGVKSIEVTVRDRAHNEKVQTYTLTVDNEGPKITPTIPKFVEVTDTQLKNKGFTYITSDEVTGVVDISGTSIDDDASVVQTYWMIPSRTQRESYTIDELAESDGWSENRAAGYSATSWKFSFDGEADGNPLLTRFDKEKPDSDPNTYYLDYSNYVYTLPLYIKSVDSVGNWTINKFLIKHNPDADRPQVEITYPTSRDYGTGLDYVVLGGTILVTGNVNIPSGTTIPDAVYLQVSTGSSTFDSYSTIGTNGSDPWLVENKYYSDVANKVMGATAAGNAGGENYSVLKGLEGDESAWWGIKAKVKGTSWNISLNENDKMNPAAGATTNIWIRACGVNAEGKVGGWSEPVAIRIDANAPIQNASVKKYSGTPGRNVSPTASSDYTADMFIKGDWYLTVEMTDEQSLDRVEVKKDKDNGSITLTESDYTLTTAYTEGGKAKRILWVKIVPNEGEDKASYTVAVTDTVGQGQHTTSAKYSFNIDNTAPVLGNLKGNGDALAANSIVSEKDYVYTISGDVEEAGSGFERVFFYFVRPGKVLINPMVTSDAKVTLSTLQTFTVTQGNTSYNMYGVNVSGTVQGDTFIPGTATQITGNRDNIRVGGLIFIEGVYRKISSIANNGTITLDTDTGITASTTTTAGFPYGMVIDNTRTEKVTGAGKMANPFVMDNTDDGDGMPETVSKLGSTYTWDGTIHSVNLPDGPVDMVILAFDKAGNVSGESFSVSVQNNAPRLAKVFLGTDLNHNTTFEDSEFETYNIGAAANAPNGTEAYTLTTANFSIYTLNPRSEWEAAVSTRKAFTVKKDLAVLPEIVGGNGEIKVVFNKNDTTTVENGFQTGTAVSKTGTLATPNTITGDYWKFSDFGGDGTKKVSFTFWDSTEECTPGTDSQYAFLRITDLNVDQVDGVDPNVVIDPFFWNGEDDNSLYQNSKANGHIELESDWTATDDGGVKLTSWDGKGKKQSTYLDSDPKVSGKIVLRGTAYDDTLLKTLQFSMTNFDTTTVKTFATYTAADGWTVTKVGGNNPSMASNYYEVTVTEDYLNQNGHKVSWEIAIDTAHLSDVAHIDALFTVIALDDAGRSSANRTASETVGDATLHRPSYAMDVVPYITGLDRPNAKTNTQRSRKGKYQVVLGEDVTISGFNLPAATANAIKLQVTGQQNNPTGTVKTQITAKNGSTKDSMTFTVPATSGYIKVVSANNISSINNYNIGNEMESEYSGDAWTDDVYLSVWKNDEYFYFSNDPISPSMDRIANGNGQYRLYGGWATQSSKFYASYPNTSGTGSTGTAPSPANGDGTSKTSSTFGDPATFYDVAIVGQNRYNVLLDCWQGSTSGWGRNFVINMNGYYQHNDCQTTNSNSSDTTWDNRTKNTMRHVIERMGAGGTQPDNADSSDGLDEIFNQFLNPRITVYDGKAYITYYDRYAKCLKWAMVEPTNSATNITTKYATEGIWENNAYTGTTGQKSPYYKNGGFVVAGYDTLQSGGSQTNLNVGMWSDIAIDTTAGKPVIAYYDGSNRQLMIATSASATYPVNTNSPVLTGTATSATQGNAWTRQVVTGSAAPRLGEYVSLALDGGNNIHIACKGAKDSCLYYVYGARDTYGSYSWTTVCVDNNGSPGTWTDIKLTNPSASGAAAGPVISYYDPTNDATEDAIKVAYYEAPAGTVTNPHLVSSNWDTMTVPCNAPATANRITLALDVTDGVTYTTNGTTNNSKLAVGYVSSRFDCVYLRKE